MADLTESTGIRNPLVLVQAMIEKGCDPDAMKKMMDLAQTWEANQARKAFQAAMVACQADMPTVVKAKENDRTKKLYAALETIQLIAKPVYTQHGFSLCFGEEQSALEGHTRLVVDVMHKDGHVQRYGGDYPWDGKGAKGAEVMNAVQGHVSSNTYGQRDLIRMVFNITIADQDADGNSDDDLIGPDEIRQLNILIEEKGVDLDRFLELGQIDSLDQMTLAKFPRAMEWLKRVKKGGK